MVAVPLSKMNDDEQIYAPKKDLFFYNTGDDSSAASPLEQRRFAARVHSPLHASKDSSASLFESRVAPATNGGTRRRKHSWHSVVSNG